MANGAETAVIRILITGKDDDSIRALRAALDAEESPASAVGCTPHSRCLRIQTLSPIDPSSLPAVECDMILLDIESGEPEPIAAMRSIAKQTEAPVLVLLGETDHQRSLEMVNEGAIDCVVKRKGYLAALPFIVDKAYATHLHFQRVRQLDLTLKATLIHLQETQEAINEELSISRRIQAAMIPQDLPRIEGLDFASLYLPSGSVGGDLFDILVLDQDHVAFLIFDVAGHGVPSALISAMAKISFTTHLRASRTLSDAFAKVNREILQNVPREYYITAFAAILDINTYVLRYANASHTSPFLYRSGTRSMELLHTNGLFVGMLDEPQYEERSTVLEKGDRLYFFTDGLYEVFDANKNMYGKARLKSFFENRAGLPGSEVLTALIEDQNRFLDSAARTDDVTALLIEARDVSRYERLLQDLGFERNSPARIMSFTHYEESEERVSRICGEMADQGFHETDIRKTRMVICEALSNAFEHGNKGEPGKKVFLGYAVGPDQIRFGVMDEGPGFDTRIIPDPRQPERANHEGGRGLFLTQAYADRFSFNEKGNRIHVLKRRAGSEAG